LPKRNGPSTGGVLGLLGDLLCQTQHAQWGYDSGCLFTLGAAFWINPFGLVLVCFDP
jgi:hypothetical protein